MAEIQAFVRTAKLNGAAGIPGVYTAQLSALTSAEAINWIVGGIPGGVSAVVSAVGDGTYRLDSVAAGASGAPAYTVDGTLVWLPVGTIFSGAVSREMFQSYNPVASFPNGAGGLFSPLSLIVKTGGTAYSWNEIASSGNPDWSRVPELATNI